MFHFFRKKKEGIPPDIGQEELPEEGEIAQEERKNIRDLEQLEERELDKLQELTEDEELHQLRSSENSKGSRKRMVVGSSHSAEVEKMSGQIDLIRDLLKEYGDRFSALSSQIGEVRGMVVETEKKILKTQTDAVRAVEIVAEVKPEDLRLEYQKLDGRMVALSDNLQANKQFGETVMEELKDIRRKAQFFVGTEAVMKLNDEVKKDLIELKRLGGVVEMHANKAEAIFLSVQNEFSKSQRISELVTNTNASLVALKKEVDKLQLDTASIVKHNEIDVLKKEMDGKIAEIENTLSIAGRIEKKNEQLRNVVESVLAIARRNKEDIAHIALAVGDDTIQSVQEHHQWMSSVLRILDSLAGEVAALKRKKGGNAKKHQIIVKEKVPPKQFSHLKVPSRMLKTLTPSKRKKRKQNTTVSRQEKRSTGKLKQEQSEEALPEPDVEAETAVEGEKVVKKEVKSETQEATTGEEIPLPPPPEKKFFSSLIEKIKDRGWWKKKDSG